MHCNWIVEVIGTGGCGGWEFSRVQILVDNKLLSAVELWFSGVRALTDLLRLRCSLPRWMSWWSFRLESCIPVGHSPGDTRGPGELVDFQGSWWTGSQAKAARGLHGHAGGSSLSSRMKRRCARGGSEGRWCRRTIETWFKHVGRVLGKSKPIWDWIWWEQEGLLQAYQQREGKRKCGPTAKWGTDPGDTRHGKGRCTWCLLHLNLYWSDWPSGLTGLSDQG